MEPSYPSEIEKYIHSNVLVGKEGYLFLWQGAQRQFDYLTGALKPSLTSIKNFSYNIKSRKAYLDKQGIKYKHIVFPSKPTVYQDRLPCDLHVKSIYESYYEKISCVSYPQKKLLAQKDKGNKIFRTLDTHLSDYGYLLCMKTALLEEFALLREQGYGFLSSKRSLKGDLEVMKNKESSVYVTEELMRATDRNSADIEFEISDNIHDIIGNTGNITVLKSICSVTKERLLIFGDSFVRKQLHLLTSIYSEIIYFRSQFFRPEIVNIFKPDIVLTANAERYLSNVQNDEETEFWCSSNFKSSTTLTDNKNSLRLLYHLRDLSSKHFDTDKYKNYLGETSFLLRTKNNFTKMPISKFFAESRQKSNSENIVTTLDSKDYDCLCQIKLSPVASTSPSNGSIRSLASFVFRGEIKSEFTSTTFINDLLNTYGPKNLSILCILRLENILAQSTEPTLNSHEATELFCSCNILSGLLNSGDITIHNWIVNALDLLLRQRSKFHLAELFKACYQFRAYLTILKIASPDLFKSIESRDQFQIKNYFTKINQSVDLDSCFIGLVKDKSVAIVGPSSCGQALGKEIDSFDTVIRMSIDNLSVLDELISGLKISINYFSGHIAAAQQQIINMADIVPCVSVTLPKFAPLLFGKTDNNFISKYKHVRQSVKLKYISHLQIYTSPNLLQVILVDVLRYNPSRVKVFYSNMFAKKTYDSNYKSVEGLRKRSGKIQHYTLSSLTMLNHDPISNFLLVKSFYRNNLIEVDPVLHEVLNMSPRKYLDSLHSNITISKQPNNETK